jgi:hypothetical protein
MDLAVDWWTIPSDPFRRETSRNPNRLLKISGKATEQGFLRGPAFAIFDDIDGSLTATANGVQHVPSLAVEF